MLVRPMTVEDCALLEPLFTEIPGSVDPRAELDRELTRAWVAEDAAGPAGFALVWRVADEYQVLALGTRAPLRRRGYGKALLEALIASARAENMSRVSLEVARANVPARALYEARGFIVFNVRRGYYQRTRDDAL